MATINTTRPAGSQYGIQWAAIAGLWKFGESIEYLDQSSLPRQMVPGPGGIALSSVRFRDGELEVSISLSEIAKSIAAGVVVGFRSVEAPYVVIQLGGFDRGYTIAEHRPGHGWFALAEAGLLLNLSANREYHVVIRVTGQRVSLDVDGVEVLSTVLQRPLEGNGLGLFVWGEKPVRFSDLHVTTEAPRVFVIMPFSEPYDTLYREVIEPVSRELGFEVTRIDEVPGPGVILDDIQRQLLDSNAVIAEISTHNPNVYYELGYAHALSKPAVLLRCNSGEKMPFDIQGHRAIFYDDTIGGKRKVERLLRQHLEAILRES